LSLEILLKQVCVQLPASAVNATLLAFAAECRAAQSCPWVALTHGLGFVGSTIAKVLKYLKGLCFHSFTARLDKIWLYQAVKFDLTADPTGTGNRSLLVVLGWVGLGPNFSHL